jgi:pyrroline-5-carboxylate reductase
MGYAMLKGLSRLDGYSIEVVEKSADRRAEIAKEFENVTVLDTINSIDDKVVILAIKPQSLKYISLDGKAKAIISILAGVSLETIREKFKAQFFIRAMPNIAAKTLNSITTVVGDLVFKNEALRILSSIGESVWVESEEELDIATALAGSSPAWLAMVAEALVDGAVNLGLSRDKAMEYIGQLFVGTGTVLKETHPAILKDMVTSPKGTTIAGIEALERNGVRSAFIEAMKESYLRAKELEGD